MTCATELFHNSIDEQLIQIYKGHRSMYTSGVQCYKQPGDDQYKENSLATTNSKLAIENQENIDPSESISAQSNKPLAPQTDEIQSVVKTALSTGGTFNALDGGNITFNFNFKQQLCLHHSFIN